MIISRTPFRFSFAGGGTDLNSYYRLGYGQVTSTAIDKYMYITVNRRFDSTLRVSYSKTEIVERADQVAHPIVRAALAKLGIESGVEIVSVADIPAGTGLGSSSSFTVGLLHAFHAYKGEFVSAERLAAEACEIEIDELREPIGKQDQYIAAFGGLRSIRFNADETVDVEAVICARDTKLTLNRWLMAFYTGATRRAADILQTHRARTEVNRPRLDRMRALADESARALAVGDLFRLGDVLHEGWMLKRGVTDDTTTDAIDRAYEAARAAGALGGKIAGAGGGGFLFLLVEPDKQPAVKKALALREVSFGLESQGSTIVYVGPEH
ncbi:MAG: GHMP kinase [Myxococcales bacterium]|nr:MAG: GHMP kinase [Myxococcales bacterium]